MRTNPYQTYIEDEILTADPVKLVQLLYRGAIEAIRLARTKLETGDIRARSAALTKTIEILTELTSSLNHERGGELTARLAALYDYMQWRLIEANREQVDPPLEEVEQILGKLEDAWSQVKGPAAGSPTGLPSHLSASTQDSLSPMASAK